MKISRFEQSPPGMEVRVGVGQNLHAATRCKATHDIPWSERCILPDGHTDLDIEADDGVPMNLHRDKKGGTW